MAELRDYAADKLEAALASMEAEIREIAAEMGCPNPWRPHGPEAIIDAFYRRVKRSPRLQQVMIDRYVYAGVIATEIIAGFEPVPGEYGKARRRPGGPLPLAEQRRVALERGLTLEDLEVARAGGTESGDPEEDEVDEEEASRLGRASLEASYEGEG
jgi:hypothetical protein